MNFFESVETTYWTDGTMEDCVLAWAKECGYKMGRAKNFRLTVKINQVIYEVVNYKPCKDGMVLIDLKNVA